MIKGISMNAQRVQEVMIPVTNVEPSALDFDVQTQSIYFSDRCVHTYIHNKATYRLPPKKNREHSRLICHKNVILQMSFSRYTKAF